MHTYSHSIIGNPWVLSLSHSVQLRESLVPPASPTRQEALRPLPSLVSSPLSLSLWASLWNPILPVSSSYHLQRIWIAYCQLMALHFPWGIGNWCSIECCQSQGSRVHSAIEYVKETNSLCSQQLSFWNNLSSIYRTVCAHAGTVLTTNFFGIQANWTLQILSVGMFLYALVYHRLRSIYSQCV